MLYEKPNMKYTDMAIYVDKHMSDDPLDEQVATNMFIYIYHIVFMLAHVNKLFYRQEYYEDFAVWLASDLFMSFTKKRENKIKSSLNYIKSVIRFRKYKFEQEFYTQTITNADTDMFDDTYSLANKMVDSIEKSSMIKFEDCLGDIINTSKKFLSCIPYKEDKAMWTNIYISCMLTLLSSIVLDKNSKEKIKARYDNPDIVLSTYLKRNEDVILFHLDEDMREYIRILTRELKHVIAKDISLTTHSYNKVEGMIDNLVLAEVNNLVKHTEDE